MKIHTLLPMACLWVGVTQCGGQNDWGQTSSVATGFTPLLVGMGGNASCNAEDSPEGMGMFDSFIALRDQLATDTDQTIPYFVTCYNSGASKLFYQISQEEGLTRTGTMEKVIQDLLSLIDKTTDVRVILTGHSYGGWLALKTTLALAEKGVHNFGLFTVDAISRLNCTWENPANCTSAPNDITSAEYDKIAITSEHWANFYQTQTFFLHSSAISQAGQNTKIATTHSQIDSHTTVWNHIQEIAAGIH